MEFDERQVDEHSGDAAGRGPVIPPEADVESEAVDDGPRQDEGRDSSLDEDVDENGGDREGEEGFLAGTAAEEAPGVGGLGDHPAPAAVRGDDGQLHVAGEPPAGSIASGQSPLGDEADEQARDVTDPEARERLNAVHEPDQIETDRPDLGVE